MALIDVTEVLFDPDFADPLVCERTIQVVGEDGIARNTPQLLPFSGVVTNGLGQMLNRIAAGERIEANIIVHTAFRLLSGAPGLTADVVQWKGRRFTVAVVGDNSHFGRGFTAASCDLIRLSG